MNAPTLAQFGHFEVLQRLAVGGMGEIFLARQVSLKGFERLAIIKTLLLSGQQDDEERVDMFLAEARIAALLNHPSIVQIYDVGEQHGTYYIIMEYVEGDTVGALLNMALKAGRHNRFAFASLMAQAARALHYAHHHTDTQGHPLQLVHRDVSPQNIMVRRDGMIKVVDFGIAKVANQRAFRTRAGIVKGKLSYMSPEQFRGRELDGRADLFSLGVVTWELTVGRRLLPGLTDHDLSNRMAKGDVPWPRQVVPDYPRDLEAVVMKAMSVSPSARYQDGNALADALDAVVAAAPAPAKVNLADYTDGLIGARVQKRKEMALSLPMAPAVPGSSPFLAPVAGGTPGGLRVVSATPSPTSSRTPTGKALAIPHPSSTPSPVAPTPTGDPHLLRPSTQPRLVAVPSPAPHADLEDPTEESPPEPESVSSNMDSLPTPLEPPTLDQTVATRMLQRPAVVVALGAGVLGALTALVVVIRALLTGSPTVVPPVPVPAAPREMVGEGPDTPTPALNAPVNKNESAAPANPPPVNHQERTQTPPPSDPMTGDKPASKVPPRPDKAQGKRPAPMPAAAANPAAQQGYLTLSSVPWAMASLNGHQLGTTPIFKLPLAPGKHSILLVNEIDNLRKTVDVEIKPGEEQRLKVNLR